VVLMMFLPYLLFDWTLEMSIYRAMVLLVVASPCALVASVMPATLSAISNSAKNNVLFKGGIHLEIMSTIHIMGFDKPGTLMNARLVVTAKLIPRGYDSKQIQEIVGALENDSPHPLGHAFTNFSLATLKRYKVSIKLSKIKTISGKG